MDIVVLSESEMRSIMNMKDAILAVEEAASEYSKGNANIPLRANLNVKEYNGDSLYMYGYVKGSNALGVKLVSVFPDNGKKGLNACPATVVLEDAKTGYVNCIMDGTYLTRLRTGALSGAATDILAREDASVFALIGTGGQAECQLLAILAVRDIKKVMVFARTKESAEKFIIKMNEKLKDINSYGYNTTDLPEFVACNPNDSCICEADIITTVTTSNEPVFDGKLVKEGCHINAVGSYTPQMSEIDEYVVTNAKTIIVDTLDGTINETGDFLKPMAKGIFKKEMVTGELGDLVDKKCNARKNATDITLFETTGSAVFDLVTAQKIFELAKSKEIGQTIKL